MLMPANMVPPWAMSEWLADAANLEFVSYSVTELNMIYIL